MGLGSLIGSEEGGGGSSSSSPPNSSIESLNGLKFGQKIYFEDVGFTAPLKSDGGPSSSAGTAGAVPPPPSKKVRGGFIQAGQPPRCLVEGCKADLSDAKAYYSRHKVCGMHSKSPKVVVAGLEQRFCQQCSRFHLLTEFDQGKRSCRRRLAGHNERRRKPPPGSLLTTRYGRLSSSVFGLDNNSFRVGSFLMDFSSHPKQTPSPPPSRSSSDRLVVTGYQQQPDQAFAVGKYLPPHNHHPWQRNYDHNNNDHSNGSCSDLFLQSSVGGGGGTGYPGPGISPGECITGVVTDSSCALSLLSNQPWTSSKNRTSSLSDLGINAMMMGHNTEGGGGSSMVHSAAHNHSAANHFPASTTTNLWGFKSNESGIAAELGLGQISYPSCPYSGEMELGLPGRRQLMELGQSRAFDSTQHMHW